MVYVKTKLRSADNSGAKLLRSIKVLYGYNKKKTELGGWVLASIKKLWKKKKVEKKQIYACLLVTSKSKTKRFDGSTIKFDMSKVLIFNKQYSFLATRIYGPIAKETILKNTQEVYKQVSAYTNKVI